MDAPHSDADDGRLATIEVSDGSRIGIARIGDSYALSVEARVAVDVVFLERDELRRLALEMIAATELDLRNPWGGMPGLAHGLGDER
jgi:hypothetical protein